LIALSTVIIFQLLLPNHLDNQFNFVNVTAALLGVGTALLLAPRFGAIGIAWAAVSAQTYTLLAFAVILWRAGLNPFPRSIATADRSRPVAPMPVLATGTSQGARRDEDLIALPYGGRQRIS
jgi:O-antigen/teichoic acid export membrane protein